MLNIRQRQMNLNFLNYNTNGVDGIEGKATKQAYKSFQRDFGLSQDGIYGEKTNAKLIEVIKNIQINIGFTEEDVDGIAGENTIAGLKAYQEQHNLTIDGICGSITRAEMNNQELSWDNIKHFKKEEFTCKCGCGMNVIDLKLIEVLENIRNHYEKPVIITSGCRCASHNKAVGGVQGSRHVLGKASDIYVQGISSSDLLSYCQELVNNGKARYTYTNNKNMSGVVHIDIQ